MGDETNRGTAPDPQEPGGGTPPPEGETDVLKRENAQLRERNRSLNAAALAARHGFADKQTAVEMLATVPFDQQEAKAQALAAEIGAGQPPAPQPPAPPAEPANAGEIASMGGAPPAAAAVPGHPPDPGDELNRKLQGASTFEEMQEIQRQERTRRMGGESL